MSLIDESWLRYKSTVYPEGIGKAQEMELQMAFLAGCIATSEAMIGFGDLDDDEGAKAVDDLVEEITTLVVEMGGIKAVKISKTDSSKN